MMTENLKLSYPQLECVFGTDDNGELLLLSIGNKGKQAPTVEPWHKKFYKAVEIHTSGSNPDEHHGSKHVMCSASGPLIYKTHTETKTEDGTLLEFLLENEFLSVKQFYRFYDDCATVRSWCDITAISDEPQTLEYVSSFAYTGIDFGGENHPKDKMAVMLPHNSWCRELSWKTYTPEELGLVLMNGSATKRILASNTGTWSTKEMIPMGAVLNKDTNGAVIWQIENNGSWTWEISDLADGKLYLRAAGPSEAENHWVKTLSKGETFKSVPVAVSFGESGFDSALESLNTYRRKIAYTNRIEKDLPVIFNDYMLCLNADPTTEKEMPVIEAAAKAGAEIYCMDAGWYADGGWWDTVGEWKPIERRFPGGMIEVFDKIRSCGMIPGIWLEIEVMGTRCKLAGDFSDDCFFVRHGKRAVDHGRYQFDFRNPKVREHCTKVVEGLISEYGIGYFKFDYNIESQMGTEVNADSFGDGLLEHNRAYLDWVDSIYEAHPDLIIENCSSGGMRMDYAMLSHHTVQSMTDQSKFGKNAVIACASPSAVIPEQAGMWCVPKVDQSDCEIAGHMVNALLCRMALSGDTHLLNDEQFAIVKEGVDCYKSIREDLKNSHAVFPLGMPSYSDKNLCLALKTKNSGYLVAVYRLEGGEERLSVKFDADVISAEKLYPTCCSATAAICGDSITFTLPEENSAALFKIM